MLPKKLKHIPVELLEISLQKDTTNEKGGMRTFEDLMPL